MLLGLDLGTGSVKAVLTDTDGSLVGQSSASYSVASPKAGWSETSPQDWWEASVRAVRDAVGDLSSDVTAIGLSGQMHGVVVTNEAGVTLRPAILWADTRSEENLRDYRGLDDDARRRLANPISVGMAGPTLLWLRDNEPETYSAARWALQPKDWLRLRLTGEVASEPSDASATLLYDLCGDDWDYEVVETLGLRAGLLAPLTESWKSAGSLSGEAADELGLKKDLPVAAGAGDTAAAMLGTGLSEPSKAQLTVGTGGQVVVPRTKPDLDPNARTHLYRAAAPGLFYSMAAIQNAGLALEWTRKILGASWKDVYKEAFSVPPGAEGVTFLPYLTGERTPHFDHGARGAWTGLSLGHSRGHLLRAALEGVTFGLRDGVESLEATGCRIPELRLAGGGTTEKSWQQLIADVLARSLLPLPEEIAATASARGAALLAGVADGTYGVVDQTPKLVSKPEKEIEPGDDHEHYETIYRGYKELYPRLRK